MNIELVRVGDRLIGRTVSDRFSLKTFGLDSISGDRNQRALKAIRRKLGKLGFTLTVVRNAAPTWTATPDEAAALGPVVLPIYARAAA
jgi:hypothetical protein